MDNQKQIKEMREDIELAIANGKKDSWYIEADLPDWIAESLDHKGYRKIPENAVVLTREEYGNLVTRPNLHTAIDVFEVRKETAKKNDDYLVKCINENFEKLKKEQELPVIREAILRGMLYVRNAEREICKEFTEGKGNENG